MKILERKRMISGEKIPGGKKLESREKAQG